MYLHLGQNVMIPLNEIIGIFDLDNTTWSHRTRRFLEQAEAGGQVTVVGDDLPRSFLLCRGKNGEIPGVYFPGKRSYTDPKSGAKRI